MRVRAVVRNVRGWRLTGLLVVFLAVSVGVWQEQRSFADSSRVGVPPNLSTGSFQTTAVSVNTALTDVQKNGLLFGFSENSTSANGQCGVYDALSVSTASMTQGVFIDEGGAATQWNTFQSNWPAPYRLTRNGYVVLVVNGTCIVYHEPITFPS